MIVSYNNPSFNSPRAKGRIFRITICSIYSSNLVSDKVDSFADRPKVYTLSLSIFSLKAFIIEVSPSSAGVKIHVPEFKELF